jgi:hypothetical protein
MNGNDDKLKALLKQWRDIEPKANFEANVWRRIRLTEAEQPESVTIVEWLQRLLWQPAFSVVAAVAIALAVGAWGGVRSAPQRPNRQQSELGFLSPGTLAGSYAQLTMRGVR